MIKDVVKRYSNKKNISQFTICFVVAGIDFY